MITLLPEWKAIFQKAWSLKFTALAMLCSGLEVFVQLVKPESMPVPNGVFAGLAGVVSVMSFAARLLAQRETPNGNSTGK